MASIPYNILFQAKLYYPVNFYISNHNIYFPLSHFQLNYAAHISPRGKIYMEQAKYVILSLFYKNLKYGFQVF